MLRLSNYFIQVLTILSEFSEKRNLHISLAKTSREACPIGDYTGHCDLTVYSISREQKMHPPNKMSKIKLWQFTFKMAKYS